MFWNRVQQGAILGAEGDTPPSLTPLVQFGAVPATVVASLIVDVSASVTILRSGALATACSVQWALTGTMTSADYIVGQALSGQVAFAADVTSQVITIRIRAAAAGTPDKTIVVTLSSPVDCQISGDTSRTILVDMPAIVVDPGTEYPTPLRTLRVSSSAELRGVLTKTSGEFDVAVTITPSSDRSAPLRGLDRVIVADGVTYTGDYSPASAINTDAGPLLIMGPGTSLDGPRFTGRMTLSRPKMWAVNLDFDGENAATSAGVSLSARYTRIHRCRFRRMDTANEVSGRIMVGVNAADCEAYYCKWDDNDGRTISGKAENMARFHMYRCWITNSKAVPSGGTAREGLQLGQTQAGGDGLAGSLSPVHIALDCLIEYCLFDDMHQLDGDENETISVKSSRNTIRQCTFIDTQYLNIRFGNDNRVESCWFEKVNGTKNRGIGVRGDRNVIIGNLLKAGTSIRIYGGNEDMTCARWDKATAGNFGTPRYMDPRATDPSWPVKFSRPWSGGQTKFDANGNVSSSGSENPDFPIGRDNWIIANTGTLDIGDAGSSAHNYWQARGNRVQSHAGVIRTQSAYGSWANVPNPTAGFRETGSTYSATVDAQFLPLPAPAKRLTSAEVGPGAPWIPPPGDAPVEPPPQWWKLSNRSGRAWAGGVAYWYDRDAPYNVLTAAQEFAAEEADVALLDAASGSSKGRASGGQDNVATWDDVIGGAIGGAMDTTDTQFDWTSSGVLYGFDDAVANLPVDPVLYPDGSGWLIWVIITHPNTLSTAVEANFAVWDQIVAGTHDAKYKKFGERVVRRMALTGHPLKRLIIDMNHEMNQSNTYRVFPSTRTKYKNAMTRAIDMIRQGASDYQAGAGDEFKFLHRPAYRENIGSLISYCPENVDCVGLSWHPSNNATNAAQLTALMNGTVADTYGIATDLLDLADALDVPICFSEHSPTFAAAGASPIADIATQMFHDFLETISDRLVADCVYHQNVRYLTGFEGASSAGDAAWRRMVPLRKTLWSGIKTVEPVAPGWPYAQTTLYDRLTFNQALTRYGQTNDQWQCATDASSRVLLVGADGNGFGAGGGGGPDSARTEWRVSRVGSTIPAADGSGLAGFADLEMCMLEAADDPEAKPTDSKPSAVLAFNTDHINVWYQFLSQPAAYSAWSRRTHVAQSSDNGDTFALHRLVDSYIFREGSGTEDLTVAGVLELGPGYTVDGSGIDTDYIYLYLGNKPQLDMPSYRAGSGNTSIWMARVKWAGGSDTVANIRTRASYQLMTGLSGGVPTWGAAGDFGVTKQRVYFDTNGMALGFHVKWHSVISRFVATYIHADDATGRFGSQGIAVALSDTPWTQSAWTMLAYGRDLDNHASDEPDNYLSVSAPARWNTGARMGFAVSTYVHGAGGGSGDNLIVTSASLNP